MSVEVERREISIDWAGEVAEAAMEAVQDRPVQSLSGSMKGIETTGEVVRPQDILNAVKDALARTHAMVPDDPDGFAVLSVDLAVDEPSTATIEVFYR